ncbi:lytic murein transglycosylase B [Pseudomonas fluvialis]|uniref:lytic murein transglycosylase B n=1 Tax=Pseudomonas fluvialis TaxID=1793966 RepID=UPI00370B7807
MNGNWLLQVRRGALALLVGLGLQSAAQAADYSGVPAVEQFIEQMTREHGFAGEQLQRLFAQAERKQAILDAISRPAERVRPWSEYRPIFITEARIQKGQAFARQHAEALARAEREYGVAAEVIVAIIGVETFYGGNTGSWRVLDALSTLCFDYPPRAPFFCQQLREFLLLTREEQVDPLSLKGSYAGAMGLPQFMPGSFRAYAVDFDGDGHINIWTNPVDAIGSVASYFKAHGWESGEPVVSRAELRDASAVDALSPGLDATSTVGKLRALGWRSQDVLRDDLPVTAFRQDGAEGVEYWMGLPNFFTITRYNRSLMYALAVHQLSEEIARRGIR